MGMGDYGHASAPLPPANKPGTHCIGGWMEPRADLGGCGNFAPTRIFLVFSFTLYFIRICSLSLLTKNKHKHLCPQRD